VQPAVLKLVAGHSAAPGQLAAWERLSGLSHPNLTEILDCGRAGPMGPAGGHFLYAVLEYPDEYLASALEGGPFSESDARDVLAAVEAGLRFLHAHGLAQTSVEPQHIVAVGDRIKLSSDTVKPLGPEATEAADWKACRALRDKLLGGPESAPAVTPMAPLPGSRGILPPVAGRALGPPEPSRVLPVWGYAAFAMMLVFLLLTAVRRKPAPAAPPPRPAPYLAAQAPVPPQAPVPAVQTARRTGQPADPSRWRVVAYTYLRRKEADHQVAQINAKLPGFVPEVLSPKGGGQPPYLVALGGRMTRSQAQTLRRQALAKGLPHGTYLRKFSN